VQSENFDRFWENWNDEKSFVIYVLCENVASSDTETKLRNHVMWLQSRDVIKDDFVSSEITSIRASQYM
jgi:hypothetical protein